MVHSHNIDVIDRQYAITNVQATAPFCWAFLDDASCQDKQCLKMSARGNNVYLPNRAHELYDAKTPRSFSYD
jgi:hypothetical protein